MNEKIMEKLGFGKMVQAKKNGNCPICGKPISFIEFRDEISKKEFKISGMCQKCQDNIFGK